MAGRHGSSAPWRALTTNTTRPPTAASTASPNHFATLRIFNRNVSRLPPEPTPRHDAWQRLAANRTNDTASRTIRYVSYQDPGGRRRESDAKSTAFTVAGVFTATEASAIAVLSALGIALACGEVRLADLPDGLCTAGNPTGVVMLLIGTSVGLSWLLSYDRGPARIADTLLPVRNQPFALLLVIHATLRLVGTFMETRPVGTVLFSGCGVAESDVRSVVRSRVPMYLAMVTVLLRVTFVPARSLSLPHWRGGSPARPRKAWLRPNRGAIQRT